MGTLEDYGGKAEQHLCRFDPLRGRRGNGRLGHGFCGGFIFLGRRFHQYVFQNFGEVYRWVVAAPGAGIVSARVRGTHPDLEMDA